MNDDEERASPGGRTLTVQPVNLAPLGIDAVRAYIAALQAEIGRAEDVIAQKTAARGHADSFFKR